MPGVSPAFTDSHFFREIGIVSYGYSPVVIPLSEFQGIHGNNERISVANLHKGTAMLTRLLLDFTVN